LPAPGLPDTRIIIQKNIIIRLHKNISMTKVKIKKKARVIIFTGKGGTGKTTSSSATAIRCAELGYKTLVMSSDSAHSLADSLQVSLTGKAKKIGPNLYGMEIDSDSEIRNHWKTTITYAKHMLASDFDEAMAYEIMAIPGIDELFTLLKIKKFIYDYDVIILDAAPTGNTLRMLAMPEAMGITGKKIIDVEKRMMKFLKPFEKMVGVPIPEGEAFDETEDLYMRLLEAREILAGENTTVRLVTNPELMCILETQRALTFMNLFGFNVDAVIANKIFPENIKDTYFSHWIEIQADYLSQIKHGFDPLKIMKVHLMDREVVGRPMLKKVAEELYGKGDPTEVLTHEKPFSVEKKGNNFILIVKLPFTEKGEMDIRAVDDRLIMKIGRYKRVILLPYALKRKKILEAKFYKNELKIKFAAKRIKGE
jgi:arsenite-transporting ATPase